MTWLRELYLHTELAWCRWHLQYADPACPEAHRFQDRALRARLALRDLGVQA